MTEKKMRAHLRRIWFHYNNLQRALNRAHDENLINYPHDTYKEQAPCASMWEVKKRIELTTKDTITEIIHSEIKRVL